MKKLLLSFIISFSLFSSYEEKITEKYKNILNSTYPEFSPQNIPELLKKYLTVLDRGDKLTLVFYPKGCGFDRMAKDPSVFLEVGLIKAFAKKLGYKTNYCDVQGHMASFEDKKAIAEFMERHFITSLDRENLEALSFLGDENGNLLFPSKICILQVEKL